MKNNQPLVSLLIPIYNVEKYLKQCLDSAANQTLRNIEIICINDGSTDGSLDIIHSFADKDSRFKIIDKANSGYGISMNQGIDICTGEYIGILESDDFLDRDALHFLYETAKRCEAEVVKSDFYLYWSVPEEHETRFGWVTPDTAGIINPQSDQDVFYLKPSIWSALYRRDFLKENNIRFLETSGASYQDAGFNFKVWASCTRAVLVDRAFLHYRQDNETSSVNSPGKTFCVCDEYSEMIRYLNERPDKKVLLMPVLVKMRFDTYMWNYERLSEELQKKFVIKMASDFAHEDKLGYTDYSYFAHQPWKIEARKAIIDNPLLFHASHTEKAVPGKWNTVKRYYKAGGISQVIKLFLSKAGM